MLLEFKELVQEVEQCEAAHFNDDRFYHNAMAKALSVKKGTLCKWTEIWVQQMAGAVVFFSSFKQCGVIYFAPVDTLHSVATVLLGFS